MTLLVNILAFVGAITVLTALVLLGMTGVISWLHWRARRLELTHDELHRALDMIRAALRDYGCEVAEGEEVMAVRNALAKARGETCPNHFG